MQDLEHFKAELTAIIKKGYEVWQKIREHCGELENETLPPMYKIRQRIRGHCGWALLYSKLHTLEKSQNNIIFLGTHPVGQADIKTENFSYEYMIDKVDYETWYKDAWEYEAGQAPLQKQVNYLLENLLNCKTENVLCGNIVPFRSITGQNTDYDDWECGKEVWNKILNRYITQHGTAKIIAMNGNVEFVIRKIFENTPSALSTIDILPTGWGVAESTFSKNSTGNIKMCRLPNLSEYGIFDRKISDTERQQQYKNLEQYIQDFFN